MHINHCHGNRIYNSYIIMAESGISAISHWGIYIMHACTKTISQLDVKKRCSLFYMTGFFFFFCMKVSEGHLEKLSSALQALDLVILILRLAVFPGDTHMSSLYNHV